MAGDWLAAALVLVLTILLTTADAATAEEFRLSENGSNLGVQFTNGMIDDLRIDVVLDGDTPIATYVYANIAASELRQRTNEGYWVPWDGNVDSLIDNQFPVADDRIVFKVMDGDIGDDNQGIGIVIAYKTQNAFKYGMLGLVPKGASQ